MIDLTARLSASITTLIAQFKMRPDGPYEGLSLIETSVVANIAAAPTPPVQGDIGSALGIPKTTMTSAVSRLERKGLVERMSSARDGRVRVLTLTPTGKDLAASLAAAQAQSSKAMLEALPNEEREMLVFLLERVADKLRERG